MLLETATQWTRSHAIPGLGGVHNRDNGPDPQSVLDNSRIWDDLRRLAKPQTTVLTGGYRADSVNFQPSASTRTQDRYVVKELMIRGQKWTLTGVFDGHLGDVTVEHVAHHLPIIVEEFLADAPVDHLADPSFISDLFSRSIIAFDRAIAGDILDLFGGIDGLKNYSDAEIRSRINDRHNGGKIYQKARLNLYGTTALVALVDPDHESLWVANLGDCQATLISSSNIRILTTEHNGYNDGEIARVRAQHPGEPDCVLNRRILGALAPFRCLGDTPFKQPPEFTRRILFNLEPGFADTRPWEEFLARNKTPPYISTEPEITHVYLQSIPEPRYLVLSSDGFTEMCDGEGQQAIFDDWLRNLGAVPQNMALQLLRRAMGSELSRILALDKDAPPIDDTSIVLQIL